MRRDDYIKETIDLLKEQYGLSLGELIDAYQDTISIPVSAFQNTLTPFEAICAYLKTHKELSEKDIAELANRRTSSVKAALKNAEKKGITPDKDDDAQYRIPLTLLTETKLSPAEAVVYALRDTYDISNSKVAELLEKDPRNTWQLYKRAQKKMGGDSS